MRSLFPRRSAGNEVPALPVPVTDAVARLEEVLPCTRWQFTGADYPEVYGPDGNVYRLASSAGPLFGCPRIPDTYWDSDITDVNYLTEFALILHDIAVEARTAAEAAGAGRDERAALADSLVEAAKQARQAAEAVSARSGLPMQHPEWVAVSQHRRSLDALVIECQDTVRSWRECALALDGRTGELEQIAADMGERARRLRELTGARRDAVAEITSN